MNETTRETMFSSATDEWYTPQDFFDALNKEYNFTLDPCALASNAKCDVWFGPDHSDRNLRDGLALDWNMFAAGGAVFMNPPYGRTIGKWVEKAAVTAAAGTSVICLLPARTDTRWFHDFCVGHDIVFVRGRLKFGGAANAAPFPSMIVKMEALRG